MVMMTHESQGQCSEVSYFLNIFFCFDVYIRYTSSSVFVTILKPYKATPALIVSDHNKPGNLKKRHFKKKKRNLSSGMIQNQKISLHHSAILNNSLMLICTFMILMAGS